MGWVWAERFIQTSNPGQAGFCTGLGGGKGLPLSRGGFYSQEKKKIQSLVIQTAAEINNFWSSDCALK